MESVAQKTVTMAETLGSGRDRQELVNVIRQVRTRWRTKLFLRGGVIFVAGSLIALILASLGLQSYKFSPGSILTLRIATISIFVLLLVGWLLRPLRRRVTDLQVALYVEEHEPSLQAAILSAVDLGAVSPDGHSRDVPPVIIEKLVSQAVERARTIGGGKSVGRRSLQQHEDDVHEQGDDADGSHFLLIALLTSS